MPSTLYERVASFFSNEPGTVLAVYVFGSAARGDARPGSDVDVAVLFDDVPPRTLDGGTLALSGHLEHHVGHPVDLIVLNDAPADLVHRVLRDGEVVFDRDRAARLRFEVTRRNEYFDLEPVRRRYRRTEHPS